SAIQQAEKDYSKLTLTPEIKRDVEAFAIIFGRYIPMSELALRGFIHLALRDFQMQTHVDIRQFASLAPSEREKFTEFFENLIYEKISKVLQREDQKQQLRAAVREAGQASRRRHSP
ncbi:MAG: hypothetical protein RBG13Loki_4159, partial [Promethearchaeota archaeon CR_4]